MCFVLEKVIYLDLTKKNVVHEVFLLYSFQKVFWKKYFFFRRDLFDDVDVIESPEEKLFDELSLSDSSEFMDVEDEANLRKRLFPAPLLTGEVSLDQTLVCVYL